MCFLMSDNGLSQIFYNFSNVDGIFSWHNWASKCAAKLLENWLTKKMLRPKTFLNRDFLYKNLMEAR